MKIFTLLAKTKIGFVLLLVLLLSSVTTSFGQTTTNPVYWTGAVSVAWGDSRNWSTGAVPGTTSDVVIGTNFSGVYQPEINEKSIVNIKSLTLTNDSGKAPYLLVTNNFNVVIGGTLTIGAGTILESEGADIIIQGSFINNGTLKESVFLKNNGRKGRFYPSFEMSGTGTIGGDVPMALSHMRVSGNVTLAQNLTIRTMNITVSGQNTLPSSDLTIAGTFDPGTNYKVTFNGKNTATADATNSLVVEAGATLKVKAATYGENYSIQPTTLYATSTVDYAALSGTQTVYPIAYGILKVSGGGTKELEANTTVSDIAATTQLIVEAGTLDLKNFTLNRIGSATPVAGGTVTVANNAILKIGGTGTFPTGYATVNLGPTSTVEYNGANQAVSPQIYGNLILNGTGEKAMPVSTFTVAGDFSSTGTVNYTAGANFTVLGDVSIGAGTTFGGGIHTITVGGHWTNNGNFIPGTSTVVMNGAGKEIRRATGTVPFHNLSITAGLIATALNVDVDVAGNLATSGAGKFTSTATLTMSGAGMSIKGEGIILNNLIAHGSTNTIATITVNGNLTVNSGKSFIATGGVINMYGNSASITNNSTAGSLQFYSLRILGSGATTSSDFLVINNLSGTGRLTASAGLITFNGTSTFGGIHKLYDVAVVNGQILTLNANSDLGIANNLTTTGATLNVTANTPNVITFNKNGAQNVPGREYFNLVLENTGVKSAQGSLIIRNNFTVNTGFAAGSYSHAVGVDLNNNAGTGFDAGTSIISFNGSGNSLVAGASTVFNVLEVNKSVASSYLQLSNNINAKDLIVGTPTLAAGEIRTGAYTITVTGNRTGMGWVYGTIKRERTFSNNTAYTFAGPYNTISLVDASGVTAIAVTNTSGIVSNFTNGNAINRRYQVDITGGSNHAGIMRLQYNDGVELNANNETLVQFFKQTSTGDSWEASSFTERNSTENWVEHNALADVKGHWSLSESAGILRWVGTTSISWETASNWQVGSTVATLAPQSGDIVQFGGDGVVNKPTLTSTTTVKAIQFLNNGSDITLTLGANANLAVNGNVASNGNGTTAKNHEIKVEDINAVLNIGGSLVLSGGDKNNLKLTVNAGNVTIAGDVDQSNTGSIALSAGTLNIAGDYKGAALTAGTGSTVNYNGTGSQIMAPVNYHHLSINKVSGVATLTSSSLLTVGGNLSKNESGTLALRTSELNINGNVAMTAGDLDAGNSIIKVAGNWTRSGGTFWPATSTIMFVGDASTSLGISGGTEAAYSFNKLIIDKGAGAVFTTNSNVRINADLEIVNGTVNLGLKTVSRTAPGGKFTMSNTATLLLENSNFPANFSIVQLNNSNVVYQGTTEQFVAPVTYGNLSFANGGTTPKRLQAATTINGTLGIAGNATLHGEGETITLKGTFSLATGGQFIAGDTYSEGTLVLSPIIADTETPYYLSGAITVNNLLLEPFSHYTISNLNPANSLTIKGDFNNNLGSINGTSLRVTFDGNFINTGALISSGVAAFTGTREQTIQLRAPITPAGTNPLNGRPAPPEVEFNGTVPPILNSTAAPQFGTVKIANTGGVTTSVNWLIGGMLYVYSGAKFHGGSYTHTFLTGISNDGLITSSGTIHLNPINQGIISLLPTNPYYPFKLGLSPTAFQSTGTLRIGGTEMLALLGFVPGVLNNVIVDNTNAAGVKGTSISSGLSLHSNWDIKGNLTVAQGSTFHTGTASQYMLATSPTTSIPMASGFYTIGGNLVNNGTINGAGSSFTLTNSAGRANEVATPALVNGTGSTTLGDLTVETSAGIVLNKSITVTKDFTYKGADLNSSNGVLRFAGTGNSLIKSPATGTVSISNLVVEKDAAANLTLEADILDANKIQVLSGTMNVASYELVKPVILAGDASEATLEVADNAQLRIGGIGTTSQLQLDKYTFTENSTVEYYNSSSTPAVSHNQVVLSEQYGNLKLSDLSTKTFATGHARIAGQLTVGNETLVTTPETIEYNGSGAQAVAAINYNNLTLSNAGTKTLAAGITGVAKSLTESGDAKLNAIANATTVNYNGEVNQAVLPANYYNLTLNKSGIKSFSGTTGIANTFTPGTNLADLSAVGNTIDFNGGTQNIPALTYKNLKVSGTGVKTLQGNTAAEENVIMGAGIITGFYNLTLGSTANLVGENKDSYVLGKVVTTRTFGATSGDSGNSTQSVTPQGVTVATETFGGIGIEVTPAVDPGTVTVVRETGPAIVPATSSNQSIKRNFAFTAVTSNANLNASVVFKYFENELNNLEESTLRLYTSADGVEWTKHSATAPDVSTHSLTSTGVNSLTRMTLGSSIKPLPVELLAFTAVKKENDVLLKWATASEQNNSGFEVQVSTDGTTYQSIGFVKSKVGSSATKQEYSFTDKRNNKNGIQYYRLKQIDFDGTAKIYGPKTVDFGTVVNASPAVVYPNPFTTNVRVRLETPTTGVAQVKLYTATGRLLKQERVQVQAGINDQELLLTSGVYEPGLYLMVIELNGQQQTIKLIKE